VPSTQLRCPVQLVSRSRFGERSGHRGYLGRVDSGTIAVGDPVAIWPHGLEARVTAIHTHGGPRDFAGAGRSVTVVLDRQVDVARGDVITHASDPPRVARRFAARLTWLDREPLSSARRYWLKHGTRTVRATVETESRLDLETLLPDTAAERLEFNDLGRVRVAVAHPLVADRFADNRAGGSFILIDEATHHTVGAGMISEVSHG
jgi:sulfate adenylyltransferase subunit 1